MYSVNFYVARIHYQSDQAGNSIPPAVKVVSSEKVTDQQSTESSAGKVLNKTKRRHKVETAVTAYSNKRAMKYEVQFPNLQFQRQSI